MEKLNKNDFANYIGNWEYIEDEDTERMKLLINENEVTFIKEKDGREIFKDIFPANYFWIEDYLCFSGKGCIYNITGLEYGYLFFGEEKGPVIGQYVWRKKFKRQ